MAKSLLEELSTIVAAGKKQAANILEGLEGKSRVTLQTRELVIPSRDHSGFDLKALDEGELTMPSNRLIYGDNLLAMAALLAGDAHTPSMRGKINLIYIDPPFDSKADYRTRIELPGIELNQKPTVLEQFAYSDTWSDGTASYLAMLTPRLVLMRELLADTGSIFVHLDWHVGHYVKIVMDEIFGRDHFINDIVWWYYNKMQGNIKTFPRNHDMIMYYRKGDGFVFNPQKEMREKPIQQIKRVWSPEKKALVNAKDEAGKVIYQTSVDRTVDDVWRLSMLQPADKTQNLKFNTQKPESLLDRIVASATNEGDVVADFFIGSGTTVAVAERLNRRWIATDLGKPSAMITRKRLIDQDAKPFLYQAIGDYQIEQARSTLGRRFRVGDLSQVVLDLFGALPLPPEENVNGSLGRLPGSKTLVFADSPSRLTTASTLRRAQGFRDTKMGGFDKVIVLGWNFSAAIGDDITGLADDQLEVRVIPPDLLDRLKKAGSEKLPASEIRFSTLQYLQAGVVGRYIEAEVESIQVALENYVLLSPDGINLDASARASVLELMNNEPLALIEYWAVDPDYDGEIFRSVWQDYRGNVDNDGDPMRVVTSATVAAPFKDGPRTVCIRAVDVFGLESEVVVKGVEVTS